MEYHGHTAGNVNQLKRSKLGNAYASLKRDQDAANAYLRALDRMPGNPQAEFGLGSALVRTGQIDKGLEYLEKVAPLVNTAQAYDRLGVAHIMAGQPEEALASFEQAYSIDSKDLDILTNIALVAALLGQSGRAAELAQKVLASPYIKPYHRRNVVLILTISGKTEAARNAAGYQLDAEATDLLIRRGEKIRTSQDPKERALALGTVRVVSSDQKAAEPGQ